MPTLTIGGELDGLCRLSRIVEALYSQVSFSSDPSAAALQLPVTAIKGINHMRFASGMPPTFVKDNDLQAELSEEDAHALIADDAALFMHSLVYPSEASFKQKLANRVQEVTAYLQPITDALLLESYRGFLPPCYCEAVDEYGGMQYGTCTTQASCFGGIDWTALYAQPIMAGLSRAEVKGLSVVARDSMHLVTEQKPSCHLPHIHGNPDNAANPGAQGTPPLCTQPQGCQLDITTITQQVYETGGEVDIWRAHFQLNWLDTGYLPQTARELKTKLKSRQAIWQAAGLIKSNYTVTDVAVEAGGESDRCGEINQAAIDWAYGKLPEATRQRYDQYGQKLQIGADLGTCIAGPCWIWDPLRLTRNDAANTMTVQSIWFGTENKNSFPCGEDKKLPCDSGFHYCKLLSPARALEWMYIDGLKNKLSTKEI